MRIEEKQAGAELCQAQNCLYGFALKIERKKVRNGWKLELKLQAKMK